MVVTLYHFQPSPPSRSVLMVCEALGIEVDVKIVDLFAKEQLNPDFVKVNPQHCLPTIVDGDLTLWESRAIAAYLVNKYGKDDSLYPRDIKQKAIVDQRLQFDCGTFYPRIRAIFFPVLFLGEVEISNDKKATFEEALGFLDIFLEGNDYVAGKKLTIADIALMASLSGVVALGWDISAYEKVSKWFSRCSLEIPNYNEVNHKGAVTFANAVKSKLAPGQI